MARLVDLSKKPYNLNPIQIEWVESTIKGMTDEEKVGQLLRTYSSSEEMLLVETT